MGADTAAKMVMEEKPVERPVPFHRASIGEAEIDAVVETLRSGWLTMGPKTREFEEAFARAVGAKHAVAVNSCTAALHLALNSLDLQPGDEIITSTYTFTATGATIVHAGGTPVLADILPTTLNLDPADVARKITPRTRAIVPVHFAGHPADMDTIHEIARAHGLGVLEDAAHALPAAYRGRQIGSLSQMTAFSFYATKNITTGEGGMLTTGDDELAATWRVRRLHGMSYDAWKRYTAQGTWRYEVLYPGFKYNTTDMNSAIGLVQLGRMRELRDRRAAHASRYLARLQGVPGLVLPQVLPQVEHAWHLFVVRIDASQVAITRDEVIDRLKALGIGTSVHFIPLHLHPYYRDTYGFSAEGFPVASTVADQALSLPLFPDMRPDDVDYVADSVATLLSGATR